MGLHVKKKASTAVALTMLFLSMLIEVQLITNVKGETLGPLAMYNSNSGNDVEISSPKSEIYNVSSILLNFTVEAYGDIYDVGFSLDEGSVERITSLTKIAEVPTPELHSLAIYSRVTFRGYLSLSNLSSGNHSVTVYQGYQYRGLHERYSVSAYSYVNFTVDTISPKISILSPEPKIYNVSDISLNYTVNEPVSKVTYNLDEQEDEATINTTLANLTYGTHNITMYAWDIAGNIGSSETVTFTIAEPELPDSFPIVPVAAVAVVAVVAACTGSLVYFKKHKRQIH